MVGYACMDSHTLDQSKLVCLDTLCLPYILLALVEVSAYKLFHKDFQCILVDIYKFLYDFVVYNRRIEHSRKDQRIFHFYMSMWWSSLDLLSIQVFCIVRMGFQCDQVGKYILVYGF